MDERPDVVVAVTDATNLERNLYLIVQLLELELPTVVVLNMMDIADKQGLKIDVTELSHALGVPIVSAVARREQGVDEIIAAACRNPSGAARRLPLSKGSLYWILCQPYAPT